MEQSDQGEDFESHYNTAYNQIMQINDIMSRAHNACLHGNFPGYKDYLNRAWMELQTYVKKDTRDKRNKIIDEFNKICQEGKGGKTIHYFEKRKLEERNNKKKEQRARIYNKLVEYEEFIRRIMFSLNFLGKRKEDLKGMSY